MLIYLALIDDPDKQIKFEKLYNTYKDKLLLAANCILHDCYEAEDAVHNAFISIAKNMDKIDDVDSNRTIGYVMIIAKNAAYDILRKRKEYLFSDDSIDFIDVDDDIEQYCNKETYNAIVEAIRNLNEVYRPVLYLHFVEGQTAKDTSRILNRNLKTIKQEIVRGKKILIEKLKEKGIHE